MPAPPTTTPTFTGVPPDIMAAVGKPDPLVTGPLDPNLDTRVGANEANTSDLQRRVSALET